MQRRGERVLQQARDRHRPDAPRHRRDDAGNGRAFRKRHVADEAALTGGSAGSGVSGAAAFAIAVVLAVAAWSPVLRRIPEVQLSPIVVSEPEEEPPLLVHLATEPLFSSSPVTATALPTVPANLWDNAHSHSLLYEYSPLAQGYSGGARLVRARFH